jgi:hypothetical protein
MRTLFFSSILFFVCILICKGQSISNELISSSGDCFENSSGMIYWSIGECMTETYASGGTILTQGFHQGEPGYWPGIDDDETGNLIKVYPNPFIDQIFIEPQDMDSDIKIVITNLLGSIVFETNLLPDENSIDGSMLTNGIYILKIIDNKNKNNYMFKIIKTK